MPQQAGFSYQGSVENLPSTELSVPTKKKPAELTMERILAKRDKIAALPPEAQQIVLDRLFDKVIGPKIPKAFDDEQKARLRLNFGNTVLGLPPEKRTLEPTEADFKRSGLATGGGGSFLKGYAHVLKNLSDMTGGGDPNAPWWRRPGMDLLFGKGGTRKMYSQAEGALGESTKAYSERHPLKSSLIEGAGTIPNPTLPLTTMIPGVGASASLPMKIGGGALRGAATGAFEWPLMTELTKGEVAKGAAFGAGGGAISPIFGAGFRKLFGKTGDLVSKGGKVKPGAVAAIDEAIGSVDSLNKIAKDKFGKEIKDLTPEQKIEAVNVWRDESVKAQKAARLAAKSAAEQEKITRAAEKEKAKVTKATATIDARLETRRAMDEARALQKEISAFVKTNKRAPSEQELTTLRQQAKNKLTAPTTPAGAAPTPAAPAAAAASQEGREAGLAARKGESVIPERGQAFKTVEVERRSLPRSLKAQIYTTELSQIRKELAEATTPEEKTYHQQRLTLKQEEAKRAMEVPLPDQFKVESPEAIKAVEGVVELSSMTPEIRKIPEGASGLTEAQQGLNAKLDDALQRLSEAKDPKAKAAIQKTVENIKSAITSNDPAALQRISDAERKALDRKASAALSSTLGAGPEGSAASDLVADVRLTPEQELAKIEESFYSLTDKLEATGAQGKLLAKNLNILWKKPPKGVSRQDIVNSGEKALEMLMGGKAPQ